MLLFFGIGGIFTFVLLMIDKSQSLINRRRIPEWFLLFSTFMFGTFGTLFGMLIFWHKVSKKSFLIKLFLVILIQFLFLYAIGSVE